MRNFFRNKSPKRIALWVSICVLCLSMTCIVLHYADTIIQDVSTILPQSQGEDTYIELEPQDTISQEFLVRGRVGGLWIGLNLDLVLGDVYTGTVTVTITNPDDKSLHLERTLDPGVFLEEAGLSLPEVFMVSGQYRTLTLTNNTDSTILVGYNPSLQSGRLTVNGQQKTGYMNYTVTRISSYEPTPLFYLMLLAVNFVVLAAAWLVLFSDIQAHTLYLLLAMGFGFVMLFDLTPMYGHDMQFHFDSSYVVSNQLMGIEGTVITPSLEDPEKDILSYYRRYGDDYTLTALYPFDFISANYSDTYRGLRNLKASEREQSLILVETYQNAIGEQLYLYLPQAVGFTIARLLGLGFYPMLQLARIFTYSIFVILTYLGLKAAPFGKRMLMILALMPASLVQAVSISRDALIIAMCFYIIPNVFAAAYKNGVPSKKEWLRIMIVSIILAPCKMAYLPVSFLWLLVIYRKYLCEQKWSSKKALCVSALLALPILIFFFLANISSFLSFAQPGKIGLDGTPAYGLLDTVSNPKLFLFLIFNTLRVYLGTYLTDAIQLFALSLGSNNGITLFVFFLLILEIFSDDSRRLVIRKEEQFFGFLTLSGVFLLLLMASLNWTPSSSMVIEGLHGRYLIPVLPLLGYSLFNCPVIKSYKQSNLIIRLGCCVFPAISLMNMYLWSIDINKIDLARIARFL